MKQIASGAKMQFFKALRNRYEHVVSCRLSHIPAVCLAPILPGNDVSMAEARLQCVYM